MAIIVYVPQCTYRGAVAGLVATAMHPIPFMHVDLPWFISVQWDFFACHSKNWVPDKSSEGWGAFVYFDLHEKCLLAGTKMVYVARTMSDFVFSAFVLFYVVVGHSGFIHFKRKAFFICSSYPKSDHQWASFHMLTVDRVWGLLVHIHTRAIYQIW